jgi:hypothetical protein
MSLGWDGALHLLFGFTKLFLIRFSVSHLFGQDITSYVLSTCLKSILKCSFLTISFTLFQNNYHLLCILYDLCERRDIPTSLFKDHYYSLTYIFSLLFMGALDLLPATIHISKFYLFILLFCFNMISRRSYIYIKI